MSGPPERHRDGFFIHAQTLLEILVVAIFAACFVAQPFRIPSESMEPTLKPGDFLLGNKQAFAPAGWLDRALLPSTPVKRGDIIVFHFPVDPSMHLVKRVIALPGEQVRLRGGKVFVDGKVLNEPYAQYTPSRPDAFRDDFPSRRSVDPNVEPRWWAELGRTISDGAVTVPQGEYFVLGDNRNESEDSRYWGFVPKEAIVARPLVVYVGRLRVVR